MNFWHRWFHPPCSNCEVLIGLLESERRDKQRLLELALAPKEIVKEVVSEPREQQQLVGRPLTWGQRRRSLEENERARLLAENDIANDLLIKGKTIDELEKEAGIAE